MTKYPATKTGQSTFDKCKVGDVVWFPGGFTIAGDWQSYGKRAKVVGFSQGRNGGVKVVPDDAPKQTFCLSVLFTKDDILRMVAAVPHDEVKSLVRGRFQLKAGDLDAVRTKAPAKDSAKLTSLTKDQLITRIQDLEARITRLEGLVLME